ncbi:MAG: stage III sporulation protein AD [Candidatus Limivivens sp.]|nr:stage III sporulation protein AD [Candidatus Limivivens sp.]
MVKIGILGLTGVLTALLLKEVKPGFSAFLSMATCILIFYYTVSKLSYVADTVESLKQYMDLKDAYLKILLKMVGITYIADFSSSLCRDAGYSAVAGQIEFFGKISILALSTPVLTALLETIHEFLI